MAGSYFPFIGIAIPSLPSSRWQLLRQETKFLNNLLACSDGEDGHDDNDDDDDDDDDDGEKDDDDDGDKDDNDDGKGEMKSLINLLA